MSLWYDLILLFFLLGGIAAGFAMGLFRQLINVAALVFAIVFAAYYHPTIARFARERLGETEGYGRDALLFFLIFLGVWLFINIGIHLSFKHPPRFLPGTLDKLVGMVVGLVSGVFAAVIVTLLLNYATAIEWPQNDAFRLAIQDGIRASSIKGLLFGYVPMMTQYLEPLLPRGLPAFFSTTFS